MVTPLETRPTVCAVASSGLIKSSAFFDFGTEDRCKACEAERFKMMVHSLPQRDHPLFAFAQFFTVWFQRYYDGQQYQHAIDYQRPGR